MTDPLEAKPPTGETVYSERRFDLRVCDLVLSTGEVERRGVIVHPGSVVILAVDQDDHIVMIRNLRWQIGQRLFELPAGTLEPGEDPALCAGRELQEETGYRADTIEHLHTFFALPGGSTEVMHAYIARGLTFVGQDLMADEDILVERLPVRDARSALLDGSIVDGKTLAILSLYLLKAQGAA